MMEVRTAVITDAEAIAASERDPDAFATVFERHYDALHRYLARRLGADLADELAADAFEIAFSKRGRYDPCFADARPWLFGIATHLIRRHRRRETRELRAYARTGTDPAAPDHGDGATRRVDAAVAGPTLAATLAALSRDERDVLLLYAWADLSYPEVAAALAISVGTVRSRLHRARRRAHDTLAAASQLHSLKEAEDGRA